MKIYSTWQTGEISFTENQLNDVSSEVFFEIHQIKKLRTWQPDNKNQQKQTTLTILFIYSIYTKFYLSRQMADKVRK